MLAYLEFHLIFIKSAYHVLQFDLIIAPRLHGDAVGLHILQDQGESTGPEDKKRGKYKDKVFHFIL